MKTLRKLYNDKVGRRKERPKMRREIYEIENVYENKN